jgi:gamma-glutamyl phosphate reductase
MWLEFTYFSWARSSETEGFELKPTNNKKMTRQETRALTFVSTSKKSTGMLVKMPENMEAEKKSTIKRNNGALQITRKKTIKIKYTSKLELPFGKSDLTPSKI